MLFLTSNRRTNNHMGSRGNRRQTRQGPINSSINSKTNLLTSLANRSVGDLSHTLSNVQQVIKVVQSAGPVIEEYAPMIKNLPTMYKLVKSINNIDDDASEESTEEVNKEIETVDGKSMPKLFF